MTIVYLVRHGETDGNLQEKFQGSSDIPLNATGLWQAQQVGEALAQLPIDCVFTSPLQRAYKTAEAIAEKHKLLPAVVEDLVEMRGGLLEGESIALLKERYPECLGNMFHNPAAVCCPQGETMRQVYERAVAAMSKIVAEHQGESIAVASHGCTISTYLHYVSARPFQQLEREIVVNASISKIVYDDQLRPRLEYKNHFEHLLGSDFICTTSV